MSLTTTNDLYFKKEGKWSNAHALEESETVVEEEIEYEDLLEEICSEPQYTWIRRKIR